MYTPWGYEIDATELPAIVSEADFAAMTGNRHAGDARAEYALAAATQAVRNLCGWHVAPSLGCTATVTADGRMLRLPTNHVTAVDGITEDGETVDADAYEWTRRGLVRRTDGSDFADAWDGIEVAYTAGHAAATVPDLASAIVSIAEGTLAVTVGVKSETAGDVSVTYGNAYAVAGQLAKGMAAALAPYRVVSAHAA